jgi:hypothetical protein
METEPVFTALSIRTVRPERRAPGRSSRPRKGLSVLVEDPGEGVAGLRDAVLYPGGGTVEIRHAQRQGGNGLLLTLRGAAKPAVEKARLLLPPQAEMLLARWAIVAGRDLEGKHTLSRLPRPGRSDARAPETPCRLERLGAAGGGGDLESWSLDAGEAVPLVPGRRYVFDDGAGALCVLSGPRPRGVSEAALARAAAGTDALDPAAVEELYLELYGLAPRLAERPPASGHVLGAWVAGEELIGEVGALLGEVLSAEGPLPVAAARELAERDRFFLPRTLWRPLLEEIGRRTGIERREGTLRLPPGAGPRGSGRPGSGRPGAGRPPTGESRAPRPQPRDGAGGDEAAAGLSPAERAVLEDIRSAGTAGEHIKSARMARAKPIVSRLCDRGLVVKLENGRLYSRNALEELSAVDGEVDDRRAAELWGVSRNTARLLIDRLVAEGLLARTSGRAAAPMGRGGGRR